MADLGAIEIQSIHAQAVRTGTLIVGPSLVETSATAVGRLKKISTGGGPESDLVVGLGKNSVDGSPTAPSLDIDRRTYFEILWPVATGVENTFTVKVRQPVIATLQPQVTILADAGLGVNSDVVGVAAAVSGWTTIGPLSVNPTSAGVLVVRLENRSDDEDPRSQWDSVVVSPGAPSGDFSYWVNGAPVFGFGGVAVVDVVTETSRAFVV